MKQTIITTTLALLISMPATTQAQTALWATGSAVPGGQQQLTRRPDGQFRFAGPLNAGELKIMTTPEYQKGTTQFLAPQLTDAYLVNYGLSYVTTTDSARSGWVVSFQEDTYRFLVDTSRRTLTGELFLPWNELLLAGSAHRGGANGVEWSRDDMVPFSRDHDDPYVFTWTGYLGHFDGVVEPDRLKLEGQMTWGPKELHPYTQDEDLLTASQLRTGGDDTKWHVGRNGTYRIRVDLFHETIHVEFIE